MAERHSEFERDADDWYCEPDWVVHRLFDRYSEIKTLHDPCCGAGNIVTVARARGIIATGSDLRDWADGKFPTIDFLTDHRPNPHTVFNPPFKLAAEFIRHAISTVYPGQLVAAIAQAKFLFSQSRHPLFTRPEMERVIVFSRRPSMPPGKMLQALGESCRGGGAMDYVWCVWRVDKTTPGAVVEWTT